MHINNNEKHPRKSDLDVFLASKLKNANFNTGFYQIPVIPNSEINKPMELVLWSMRHKCANKNECGLIFYEYDCKFDGKNGIYNVLKYGSDEEVNSLIKELSEFAFVVCPDYSVYGNFPNYKQIEAMSKSREVGYILWSYGIKVVINYRATYDWSYELALSGIPENAIISIGTLGALKDKESRKMLKDSITALIGFCKPMVLIVYGYAPNDVFEIAIKNNIEIWQFDSEIAKAFGGK